MMMYSSSNFFTKMHHFKAEISKKNFLPPLVAFGQSFVRPLILNLLK